MLDARRQPIPPARTKYTIQGQLNAISRLDFVKVVPVGVLLLAIGC